MNVGAYLRGEDRHVGSSRVEFKDCKRLVDENMRLHKQNQKLLKAKQKAEQEAKVWFDKYQEIVNYGVEKFCIDEGCPHHGTTHVCNPHS